MGRRLALLIATYEFQDTELRRLTAPAHDAESLAEVLADPDVANFEVTTLVNEPHHRVGEAIGDFYRDRRRDDLTLLYFTGHGLKDDNGHLYLAMANTRRDTLLFTALSAEHIDQAMRGCMSRQQVLILDCCYSGAFPAGRLAKADPEVHTLERFQGRGRTVLTASDATQYSFEGDTLRGEATQSVFTRYLVAGLRDGSADLDNDGDITLDELYSYVHDRVVAEMPQQRPKKQDNVEGRTIIARNINWTLPSYLRNALKSPIAADRLAAMDGLDHLHRIGNAAVRATVLTTLASLTDDDSRQVSAAATTRLAALTAKPAPEPEPEPEPPPTPEPAPVVKVEPPPEPEVVREVPPPPKSEPGPKPAPPLVTWFTRYRRRLLALAAAVVSGAVVTVIALINDGPGGSGTTSGDRAAPQLSSMAISPDGGKLYVATADSRRLSVIDTVSWKTTSSVDLPVDPVPDLTAGLAVANSGANVYLATNESSITLRVYGADGTYESEINIGDWVAGVALSADDTRAYVLTSLSVVPVDLATRTALGPRIRPGGSPTDVVTGPENVYVGTETTVYVIDSTNKVISSIPVCVDDLAISPEGDRLYALCDSTSEITVIDTTTMQHRPLDAGGGVAAMAVAPDGRVYVSYSGASAVAAIDPDSAERGTDIPSKGGAVAMVSDKTGGRVIVAEPDGSITVIDTATAAAEKAPVRWSG